MDPLLDTTSSWPAELVAGASLVAALFALIGGWRGLVWFRGRRERTIQADIKAGRFLKAIDTLVKLDRLTEAAALQVRRGQPDAAAELFTRAGDIEAAARVYSNGGDWQMAAITLKEAGLLLEAAEVYRSAGQQEAYAELLTEGQAYDRAAAVWKALGRLDRVADIRATLGDEDTAQTLRAQYFEATGDHAAAAALWEAGGETDKAIAAWRAAARPDEIGRIKVAAGALAEGAQLMMDGGAFLKAAPVYQRLGKFAEAARAAYRGGDVPATIGYLHVIGDHQTIAKVFFQYGMREDAKRALGEARPGSKAWAGCQETLAAALVEEGNPGAAFQVYGALVEHAVTVRQTGASTRKWLLARFRMLLERQRFDLALAELERARDLGLSTPEIEQYLRKLGPKLQATMSVVPGQPLDPEASQAWVDAASSLVLPQHPRYHIQANLGQGANGVVYRAWDSMLDRPLVVKMIANNALPSDVARKWFLREAKTAARLNHPNIVTIYDMGDIAGQPFIAMELVEGQDLKRAVKGRLPLGLAEVVGLFGQLTAAVSYAHAAGVVHRDIKLDNLMIAADGVLKLMDFGLAQAFNGPEVTVVIAGTPAYMSPEQIRGMDVDHQTDVYAMGVLLFKLLTGEYPFQTGNVLEHHRSSPVPDPRKHNPTLPEAVSKVIAKAMAKAKADRYPDAESLLAGLRTATR